MRPGFDQPFTVHAEDGAFAWSVELLATLGDQPGPFIEGPAGTIACFAAGEDSRGRIDSLTLAPGDYVPRVIGRADRILVKGARGGRIIDSQ